MRLSRSAYYFAGYAVGVFVMATVMQFELTFVQSLLLSGISYILGRVIMFTVEQLWSKK